LRLRYDGPGHRLLAYGKTLRRGEEATFTDVEARALLKQRHLRFSPDPVAAAKAQADIERPSAFGSRRQWAAYAEKHGVNVSTGMTRDDIIAAVDAPPPGDGEPEAHQGEGQTTTEQEIQ
jgi:hypothetical protein